MPSYSLVSRYRRKGNDLFYTHSVTLQQAINSEPAAITTLDGRTLLVPFDEIISPKTVKKIEGEGMPIYDGDNKKDISEMKRGDLYIVFDI